MRTVYAQQGDTVDLVADREYGTTDMVTAILAANPGLARLGAILPIGTPINLPPAQQRAVAPAVTLW